ncbi:MAG: acetylxylan esterase [Candidatus Hydrogenedentes bacterium]|nr:acetylxylan esterase [Candidatus Hydrogenedentota bacterium]
MLGVLLALSLAAQPADVIWLNAYDAVHDGVAVPERAHFNVWVWTDDRQPSSVVLGDARLANPSSEKPKGDYVWRNLGAVTVKKGTAGVTLDRFAATLVLAADPQYKPGDAMRNIRVSNKPDPVSDNRAETYRDSDSYHMFPAYASRADWEKRVEEIRLRMRIAGGLLPMPDRTQMNERIFDTIRHDDYTVAKVTFESRPGYLVTGNLYTPKGEGPFPAVLCPHGHWKSGRLEDSEKASVPARCITFARMGIVAFSYDMVGFQDSKQFPHEFNDPRNKLWSIDTFAFQLWNSIRAIDFVQTLPAVDKGRIGCTGGSGGGTQTFTLCSVDDRISVAAPVNIISCSTQADCSCESPPIMRMNGISDMEIGAVMAPRPLLMVSATGDWTLETPRVEYPAIRSIYKLYNATDKIEAAQFDAGHNYNKASREVVYRFFGKWLLGRGEQYGGFTEPPYTADPADRMRVFPGDQQPEGYPSREEIVRQTIEAARARWKSGLPTGRCSYSSRHGQGGARRPRGVQARPAHSGVARARQVRGRDRRVPDWRTQQPADRAAAARHRHFPRHV